MTPVDDVLVMVRALRADAAYHAQAWQATVDQLDAIAGALGPIAAGIFSGAVRDAVDFSLKAKGHPGPTGPAYLGVELLEATVGAGVEALQDATIDLKTVRNQVLGLINRWENGAPARQNGAPRPARAPTPAEPGRNGRGRRLLDEAWLRATWAALDPHRSITAQLRTLGLSGSVAS